MHDRRQRIVWVEMVSRALYSCIREFKHGALKTGFKGRYVMDGRQLHRYPGDHQRRIQRTNIVRNVRFADEEHAADELTEPMRRSS
jgi:hypothetical protein